MGASMAAHPTFRHRRLAAVLVPLLACALLAGAAAPLPAGAVNAAAAGSLGAIVPVPVSVTRATGTTYTLSADAGIVTEAGSTAAADVGAYLAGILRASTGYALPVA